MIKLLCFFILFCLFFSVRAQGNCKQVLVTGNVEDTINPQQFYNLMIVNRTRGRGVFGQPNGRFSVYVSEGDSISISITGYPMVGFRVIADSNCQYKFHAYLDLLAAEIKEVVITPLKTLNQIREERQALAMRETRQVTGISGLGSPITLLYQTFSQKEKNKRWIAKQEFKDSEVKIVKELLRLYVSYDIIHLSDDQFDEFISFLNIDESFLKTATEMELITFVKDKFDHFKSIHSIQFHENDKWRTALDSLDKRRAMEELLRLYNAHDIIILPESHFDKFIPYLKLEDVFMRNASEQQLIEYVQKKFEKYSEFYSLRVQHTVDEFSISEFDSYLWRAELSCVDNKKAAVLELLRIYRKHFVISLPEEEQERFTKFLNVSQSFLEKSTEEEVLNFVLEKYEKYVNFYKIR
jgi:hypothetical protein